MSRRRPASSPCVPLTVKILGDDDALGEAIGPVLAETPKLARYTKDVRCRERALRKVLNNRQWRVYMALEEAVIDRVLAETNVLIRWAFDEGVRAGRSRSAS